MHYDHISAHFYSRSDQRVKDGLRNRRRDRWDAIVQRMFLNYLSSNVHLIINALHMSATKIFQYQYFILTSKPFRRVKML